MKNVIYFLWKLSSSGRNNLKEKCLKIVSSTPYRVKKLLLCGAVLKTTTYAILLLQPLLQNSSFHCIRTHLGSLTGSDIRLCHQRKKWRCFTLWNVQYFSIGPRPTVHLYTCWPLQNRKCANICSV